MLDIDTVYDYHTAQLKTNRKRILIEYVEGPEVGTGHRRRAESLAAALQHHDVELIRNRHLNRTPDPYDMIITDTLDNYKQPPAPLWVTFEDHGKAIMHADLIINALYPYPAEFNGTWWPASRPMSDVRSGPGWAVLRPEFQSLPPFEVRDGVSATMSLRMLVMFGGTDPAGLHELTARAFDGNSNSPVFEACTVVQPGDAIPVAATMRQHDILITSAGRTVYEAAAVGIPSIVLAQNNREATHVHLGPNHGNIYLGLGRLVTPEKLRHTVEQVAADQALRQELSDTARGSIDGRGLERIVHAIDGLLKGL
jgi:spore coat polysaccharide biosynthesis predicted glycosyltransferase SpsG